MLGIDMSWINGFLGSIKRKLFLRGFLVQFSALWKFVHQKMG
jgi:hypothetical protein